MCRHGTTTWNLAKKWQGQQDTELAPEGIRQAEETGRLLASKIASKTPKIFTSDLKRAKRTAELYAAAMATTAGSSTPTEVEVEERLREPSLGKFEGMVKGREKTCERLHKAYFEGLETPSETSLRVEALAAEVFEDGDVVLFVTHSKVLEAVLAKVFGKFYEGVHTSPGAFFVWNYSETKSGSLGDLGELHQIECHDYQVEQ
ncbi:unnamed protein product [Durusdinium trenchii]|uniref:Phosphoglycerate mutase n=1 Tax=Durusdinium trenchii TaxID=1381693 RepID=A0ABP0M7S6_9DINO